MKPEVRANLEAISDGNLDSVLAATNDPRKTSGLTLTPLGVPVWAVLPFLWFLLATPSYFATLALQNVNADDADPDTQMLVSAPALWVIHKLRDRNQTRESRDLVHRTFPELAAQVDRVNEVLDSMSPSGERDQLVSARNDVLVELNRQAKLAQNSRSEESLKSLSEELEGLSTFLRTRAEVRNNLDA